MPKTNDLGTRLRNPERLLRNLQYEDAVAEAGNEGHEFPLTTSELLQQAIMAFSQFEQDENQEGEQEEEEEMEEEEAELPECDGDDMME